MEWFFAAAGRQEGPVSEEELIRMAVDGRLKPTDHVWNETMGDKWALASTVPGLFGGQVGAPPAVPGVAAGGEDEAPRQALTGPGGISCVAAVRPAWDRMKAILFAPFDIGRWFVLGFSAWLATLGEGGGGGSFGSGRSNFQNISKGKGGPSDVDFGEVIDKVQGFLREYGNVIALVVAGVVVVGLMIGLVIIWLRSRGKFMFIDNVVNDRAEISAPWRVFAQHGNSLFRWVIGYSIVCLLITALFLAITFYSVAMPCIRARTFVPSAMTGIVLSGVLWIIFGVVAGYINRFLEDFVVPIMYKFDLSTTEAWGRFIPLLKAHFGKFFLYGLFYLVLGAAAGICVLLLVIATCCIAGCLMSIPYVGAVLLLPVTVFFRAYSIEYLAQFGPGFVLEPHEEEIVE